jgi:DNA repair protein RecO (recombination protein O)
MGLVDTEALVLKSYGLSDADKIVVFLTEDHGLVRGVAKGAKKPGSHFGSSLEPCSFVRLSYFQKDQQELVSVRSSEITKSFFDRVADPLFLQRFSYLAELLGEFTQPNDPNPRIYNMARVCLEAAVPETAAFDTVLMYFELWLLKLSGYLPDWSECAHCRRKLRDDEGAALQSDSSLICANCRMADGGRAVTAGERGVYLEAQRMGPDKFLDAASGMGECVENVSVCLRRIIAGILGRDSHEGRILSAIY